MRVIFYVLLIVLVLLAIYGIVTFKHHKRLVAALTNYSNKEDTMISEYTQKVIELKQRRQLIEKKLLSVHSGKLSASQLNRLKSIDDEITKLDSAVQDLRNREQAAGFAGSYNVCTSIYGKANEICQTLSEDTLPLKPIKIK